MWVALEGIMLSEMNQNTRYVIILITGIRYKKEKTEKRTDLWS